MKENTQIVLTIVGIGAGLALFGGHNAIKPPDDTLEQVRLWNQAAQASAQISQALAVPYSSSAPVQPLPQPPPTNNAMQQYYNEAQLNALQEQTMLQQQSAIRDNFRRTKISADSRDRR
jgi:hypothetical protein